MHKVAVVLIDALSIHAVCAALLKLAKCYAASTACVHGKNAGFGPRLLFVLVTNQQIVSVLLGEGTDGVPRGRRLRMYLCIRKTRLCLDGANTHRERGEYTTTPPN